MDSDNKFPRWLLITLIVFGALMITWQMLVCGGITGLGDTNTYLRAWFVLSNHHVPDPLRPPVYPIFIGTLLGLFGEFFGMIIILIINWTIWIIGCRATWQIMQYFNVGRRLRIATILAFIFFTGGWFFNNTLHAESLASGSIPLLVLWLIRYLSNRRKSYIIYSGLLLYGLIFLKPQFIYLIPLVSIAWIYLTRKNRRQLMLAISIPLITIASLWFYSLCLHRFQQLDVAFSTVSSRNNYYSMRMAGLIYANEIEDREVSELLRPYLEADPGTDNPDYYYYWDEIELLQDRNLEKIWRHAYSLHSAEMNRFILHRFPQSLSYSIFFVEGRDRPFLTDKDLRYYELINKERAKLGKPVLTRDSIPEKDIIYDSDLLRYHHARKGAVIYPLYKIADIPFWVAWLSMLLFAGIYIYQWLRQRQFPVVAFLTASIPICGYITVIIFAPCDWGRLVTPYYMLLFCCIAIILNQLTNLLRKCLANLQ